MLFLLRRLRLQNHRPFPPNIPRRLSSTEPTDPISPRRRLPFFLLSGTLVSTLSLSAFLYSTPSSENRPDEVEKTLERMRESVGRVWGSMRQTGVAAAVLWRSLASVLSSANHEVKKGFELRVAALVADIAAANEARRASIVTAGNGAVVDWLLETVAVKGGKGREGTQAESARALAHLLADPNVCGEVLRRRHAVPNLLKFIFSFQPKQAKKHKHSSLDGPDFSKGRSMLVAAIMDIITSNYDDVDNVRFHPSLSANADMGDIAAAIEVIEEGGLHFGEPDSGEEDEDDGDRGIRGIGIKVLGGTTVLGFSGVENLLELNSHREDNLLTPSGVSQKRHVTSSTTHDHHTVSVPGLWDDLQREYVAVPFAAWALANWALASGVNRSRIHELDRDGHAILTALTAPERTVKWHGSLVARVLLEDHNLPLADSVRDWCFSLLTTIFQASKNDDSSLASAALSAFLVSLKRSDDAKMIVMEKGLHLLRETAKGTESHGHIQEKLGRALELICTSDMHLSLEDSQKWVGILLRWIFSKSSSNSSCSSATKIISCILEDHGAAAIPISQGWLTMLLTEIIECNKLKETPVKSDKVQTKIEQSNALVASQAANQLATAVISLSKKQFTDEVHSMQPHPLADFLSLEPFAAVSKNTKKEKLFKFDAADAAVATLKAIKALTELCSTDTNSQNKIVDSGVLCLLRRFLLADDYEKLAAVETYDASRSLEPQQRKSSDSESSANANANDFSSVRVPQTGHIRRHAARLLVVISVLPKVKSIIREDLELCKWLEDCANGMCCNDLKIQSYARAILLNVFCPEKDNQDETDVSPGKGTGARNNNCPRYSDTLFFINPEMSSEWKYTWRNEEGSSKHSSTTEGPTNDSASPLSNGIIEKEDVSSSVSTISQDAGTDSNTPLVDVVFVHGLRGGPFKSWRITENKSSTTSKAGLVENIDQEAGKEGTFWPKEWLSTDFPHARLFTVKYKTNLSQWTGASLPVQEVSSMLLQKLIDAGIGDRPVVFVTHSMGGLVVKQMLYQAKMLDFSKFINNTIGIVFYSCPHFGSKLADMPWRMGLVLRPAPSIGELRSGSPKLMEINEFVRTRYNKGLLKILSFSETQVTPIVEGYGGWAFRMEIVPIESAYPGFGDIIVLEATDHINSCKPINRSDPSYAKTLDFLKKLRSNLT